MLDKIEYLEDGKIRYSMLFSLNVMEATEHEYGTIENWTTAMSKQNGEPGYSALKFMVLEVINEGIDFQNEKLSDDKKRDLLTSKQVGRLISRLGFEKVGKKVFKMIGDSFPKDDSSKNAVPTQKTKK